MSTDRRSDETKDRVMALREELDRLWRDYVGPPGISRRTAALKIAEKADAIAREIWEYEP